MTKSSIIPHKNVLCLICLTTEIRQKMIENNYNPDNAIKKLKGIGVDVCNLSIQNLSKINQYKLVIIICHHRKSQDIDALVLSDNTLLPVDGFVHAISTEYTGLLDLAICQSKEMAYEIKALSKYPNALKIQYAEEETDVEFRLCYIYPDLMKSFSFEPTENYRERYREAYQEAVQYAIEKQTMDPSSLLEGTKLGTNSIFKKASIGAPTFAERNTPFLITIIIHKYRDKEFIKAQISGSQEDATIKREKDDIKIKNGDKINISLSFDSDETYNLKGEGKEQRIWNDDCGEAEVSFSVTVLPKFTLNAFNAVIDLDVNGKPYITNWKINIKVRYSDFSEIKKVDYGRRILPDNPIKEDPISPRTIVKPVIYVDEPKFEEMQEFEPIDNEYKPLKEKNMQLDMSKTYELFFDKDGIIEGTHVKIKGIDLPFFEKMVTHAWFEPLYREGLKTNIRCLIRNLSQHFPKMWLDELLKYDYMKGVTRKTIQSATEPTLKAIKNEKRKDFGISTKPKEA